MKRTSNSVSISRLMPGIDLGIMLIVLTCGMAGLSWLTASPPAISSEDTAMPVFPEEKAKQIADLRKEIERLRHKLEQKEGEAQQFQAALDKAEADSPNLAATRNRRAESRHDLEKLRQRFKDLKNRLHELEQEVGDLTQKKGRLEQLRKAIGEIKRQMQQLAAALEQLKQASKTLRNDINEMRATPIEHPTVRIDFYPVFTAETKRESMFVVLAEGMVTPMRKPYYTSMTLPGSRRWSRVRHAESIEQALAQGSAFLKLLGEIDRKSEYVFLVVDSSSFETFRKVRELLQRRGIPFGWDANNNTANIGFGPGGGPTGTFK